MMERYDYFPHHAVVTEKKPGKIRVVFDCAAALQAISLNNQCHKGPDLNNMLLGILSVSTSFHMADIEAMYHQVKILEKDRNALRLLWSVNGSIGQFRMTSHLFGGVVQ